MTTKKTIAAARSMRVAAERQPSAYHRLDELLHTIRCITQYEDRLCELSHDLKRGGGPSAEIYDELRVIIDKVPSHEFVLDLEAVREALVPPQPPTRVALKKSAAVQTGKTPQVAGKTLAKKAGRTLSR